MGTISSGIQFPTSRLQPFIPPTRNCLRIEVPWTPLIVHPPTTLIPPTELQRHTVRLLALAWPSTGLRAQGKGRGRCLPPPRRRTPAEGRGRCLPPRRRRVPVERGEGKAPAPQMTAGWAWLHLRGSPASGLGRCRKRTPLTRLHAPAHHR